MHDFVHDMTSWYDQVRKLPRPVIAKPPSHDERAGESKVIFEKEQDI